MRNSEENNDRKPERKPKSNKKTHIKKTMLDDDVISNSNAKKHIKKVKQSFEDEEWQDWDKYYNH